MPTLLSYDSDASRTSPAPTPTTSVATSVSDNSIENAVAEVESEAIAKFNSLFNAQQKNEIVYAYLKKAIEIGYAAAKI